MRTCLAQIFTLLLSVTITCLLRVSKAQSVQFAPETEGETFRNLISAHSHLLLGSSRAIYRLDDDLVRQQKRTLTGPSRMLVADYVGSFRSSFLSCDNITCFLAQLTDFESVSWQVNSPLVNRRFQDNAVGVLAPRANGTSDLTYGERAGRELGGGRLFAKGSLYNAGVSNAPYSFLQYARRGETNRFDPLVYLTEFPLRFAGNDSGFVYFITHPTQNEIRVVRFCEDDGGVLGSFVSHFEAVLQCGSTSGSIATDSTSATFINITATFNNRPTILVTQTRMSAMNVQLEVCSFDIGNINFLMTQKYDDCVTARNNAMAGFFRDGQALCSVVDEGVLQNVNECFLPGTARPGLEVLNPYVEQPLSTLAVNSVTTSIAHTTLDGALFLFAATTNGDLIQFHISSPTQATHVRTVSIPVMSFENVTKMVSSDSGEHIVAMTPSRVFRHSVDMCHTFTSCTECLTSGDPICGWCPLSGSCTRQSNCPSVQPVSDPIWLTDVNTCPTISTINPSVVYIPQLMQQTVEFTMSTMNIASTPLTSYTYSCQFNFQNANSAPVVTPATQTNGQFTCDSPSGSQVPQLASGQDTLDTMVSLVVAGSGVSVASLEMFFPFTDCVVHDSCTSCIGDSRCEWCPFSFKCVQPGTTCAADNSEMAITNGGVCPQIFPSSVTGEYLIHADHTYSDIPLRINSSDLSQFRNDFDNGQFRCEICSQSDVSCDTPLFSSPAQLSQSGNEVLCQQRRYDAVDNSPSLSARLRVVWNSQRTIDNPNDASVILYSCSLMGTNCGQCLAQEPRFECSYCYNPTTSNGDCLLKVTCSTDSGLLSFMNTTDVRYCPRPQILDFEPKAGPTKGGTAVTIVGTNLGARREDVGNVMIDGVSCNVTGYEPGVSITCVTGVKGGSITSDIVSVYFNHVDGRVDSEDTFMFVTPFLNSPPADPGMGPRSGGTNITIRGTDIGIGSSHRVLVGQRVCVVTEVKTDSIMCTTPSTNSTSNEVQLVQLSVDNWTSELSGFEYVEDPTFESIMPKVIFESGGMNYTVTGQNLMSVAEPRLLIYYEGVSSLTRRRRQTSVTLGSRFQSRPCVVESNMKMYCTAPSLSDIDFNQTSQQLSIGLLMDGVTSLLVLPNTSFTFYADPIFESFSEEQQFTAGDTITLTIGGSGFNFDNEQVEVYIDPCRSDAPEICQCSVTNVFPNNTLTCVIDIISQRELQNSGQPLTVTVVVGNQMEVVGTIRIRSVIELEILYYLIPVFAALIVTATVVFIVLVAVFCRKARQKDRKYDQLILELEKLESSVARECKIGFAELQTDLDELTGDVVGCRLPYRDLQNYLLTTLFPGASTHPVLQPLQIPSHRKPVLDRALRDFSTLLNDKRSLLIFIRSMEEQRGFTIRDKSIVGSLLIVALHNKLDYATDVLKSLLSELIRKTVQQSYPKLLLRRTESVAEKMLTNWLAFCLHGYVMEHVGQPMYLLYRAVKNQLEKGPIDVITGEARYSLSEQKLIRQKVDIVVLDATVETEDGLRVPVKLLDCDTISQAKEKMLDAVFKAAPVSQRPALTHVDLEYIKSPNERAILRDEDSSNTKEGDWKKINTLKHYWISNGALLRLIPRRDYAPPGRTYDYPGSLISTHTPRQRALSEAEDGTRVWHLFKQLDTEDPKRSPFMNKKLVSEIYLPRMLSTKSILQKFADDLFHSLFSISHPPSSPTATYMAAFPNSPGVQVPMGYAPGADAVPMAVKYLFDFLDDEAEAAKIVDTDVVHTWKNNALSLRFWVNLIKNPEFVFDINKSHTVDACLSVIAQAFIDGCSSSEMKLTIDSPTSKLLYNKEVQGYKAEVKKYYDDVKHLPRIPEDAMQYYLRQLSSYQSQQMRRSGGFVVESALHDLLRYADKYHEPFLRNLRGSGLESKAQLFEGVLKVFSN